MSFSKKIMPQCISFFILAIFLIHSILYCISFKSLRFAAIEHSPIENATAVFYLVAIVVMFVCLQKLRNMHFLHHIAFSSTLLARELDCHKSLTGGNALKVSFYLKSEVAVYQKIIIAIITFTIICYVLFYLAKYIPRLYQMIICKYPWAITLLISVLSLVMAKTTERVKTIFRKIYEIDRLHYYNLLGEYCEEYLEMMIPVFIIVACVQFIFHREYSQLSINRSQK